MVGGAQAEPGSSAPIMVRAELSPGATGGLSATRSGSRAVRLPRSLDLVFRAHVSFGLLELLVAHDGHLVATTPNQELVELDAAGKRLWAVSLPGVPMRSGVLADGTRLVASDRGKISGFGPRGSRRFEVDPGWVRPSEPTHLLPLAQGGFVAANLRQVRWYESDGRIRASTTLDEAVQGLSFTGRVIVVSLRSGRQVTWNGRDELRSIGDFGAPPLSPPVVWGERLVALTESAVVSKDPITGRNLSLASDLDIAAGTVPFAIGRGELGWLGMDNALVRVRPGRGESKLPLGLETTTRASDLGAISDDEGNVALINALGELTLVDASGQIVTDSESRCADPVALLPQGPGRLILACRTGSVWAFGH
jgi:hypothetical protein